MLRVALIGFAAGILAVLMPVGRASLHHPNDPVAIPVNAKGEPEALPFDEFARRRLVLRNEINSAWPLEVTDPQTKQLVLDKTGKPRLTERGVVAQRIAEARKKRDRTPDENAALAVDLLRFGQPLEADSTLAGQRRGFLPNITLAHIAMAQADWPKAYEYLDIANDERAPTTFPGLSPQELAWQLKLNRGALLKLVKLRLAEARGPKPPPEEELPDALFPVNFANVAGGALTPAEQAKLPPDALATVQQLVLWFPTDTRLYWLLAELFAVKGDFAAARKIMDECVDSGHYSNRKVLMQHREAVVKAAKEKGVAPEESLLAPAAEPPVEEPPAPAVPFSLGAVWMYFGAVAAIALFAFIRTLMKKGKGGSECGPVG